MIPMIPEPLFEPALLEASLLQPLEEERRGDLLFLVTEVFWEVAFDFRF